MIDTIDLALQVLGVSNAILFVLLIWVFVLYRKLNRKISGIGANVTQNIVDAATIADWKQKARQYGSDTNRGKAYRNRLKEIGHPYRGD